jgi:hypothetical protein
MLRRISIKITNSIKILESGPEIIEITPLRCTVLSKYSGAQVPMKSYLFYEKKAWTLKETLGPFLDNLSIF